MSDELTIAKIYRVGLFETHFLKLCSSFPKDHDSWVLCLRANIKRNENKNE